MAEIQYPNTLLGPGTFTAVIEDNNGNPRTVLEAGQDIHVKVAWTIDPLSALLLGGQWAVSVYAESMGPGPEKLLVSQHFPVNGHTLYKETLVVPKDTLPNNPPPEESSGSYKVVIVLTHRNFSKISNIAAVVEGPVLRIA